MSQAISDLALLLRTMEPVLNEGVYCFATITAPMELPLQAVIATIQEKEGLSVVVSKQTAEEYQLNAQFLCSWISLNVHSDLSAVGLTAAFATALGNVGISCNVVAGNYHDHLFVPLEKTELAMQTLLDLQQEA